MIVKTRAVVLREIRYRDQSKICSLYSRDFGKISVIVKGARNPKNKLSGLFNAGNVIDLVLYRKNNRELHLASDGNLVLSPMVPEPDLLRFAVLYRIIDLVRLTTENDEKNLPLFSLLTGTLEQLYRKDQHFELLYAWFLLRFVSLLGFQPSLRQCVLTGEDIPRAIEAGKVSGLYFVMNPGGFALPWAAATSPVIKHLLPLRSTMLLCTLETSPVHDLETIRAEHDDVEHLWNLLQDYCSRHLEHTGGRKNLAIVSQISRK
ncbi:MAG: DNA repair protein RecO [Chlorobium sp.]|nr:MAG: DNA repair protein RecO [Chlorobium sp.]